MKPKSFPLFSIARTAFLATLTATSLASAATFTWDADGVAPLNDGAATWNATGGTNWNTGATYGTWGTTTADEAVFGVNSGAAGIVTVGTVTANKLTFNAPGPTKVAGGTLGGTTTLGNVSVANLAALEGGAGAPGTLTAADVTLGSGAADTTSLRGKLSATAGYQALAVTTSHSTAATWCSATNAPTPRKPTPPRPANGAPTSATGTTSRPCRSARTATSPMT